MACRRGRTVRWLSRSPYSTDDRPHHRVFSRSFQNRFTEIGVEVLLDWSASDSDSCQLGLQEDDRIRMLPPPCWLLSESPDAYAFTVKRPGEVGLSPEDVEVQMEHKSEFSSKSEYVEQERWSSGSSLGDEDLCNHRNNSSRSCCSRHGYHQDPLTLLTIFCERLAGRISGITNSGGSSHSSSTNINGRSATSGNMGRNANGEWSEKPYAQDRQQGGEFVTCFGLRSDSSFVEGSEAAAVDLPSCSCCSCSRAKSGFPWKFGRRFSLPLDAIAEKAVAAHANGAVTVLVPRRRAIFSSWVPSCSSSSNRGSSSRRDSTSSSCAHFTASTLDAQASWMGESDSDSANATSGSKRWHLEVASVQSPTSQQFHSSTEDVVHEFMDEFISSIADTLDSQHTQHPSSSWSNLGSHSNHFSRFHSHHQPSSWAPCEENDAMDTC